MDDLASQLTDEQMAELSALADGTLPAARRPAVEAWVTASPAAQLLLDRQRRSLAATRVAASEPMPASLGATVGPGTVKPRRRHAARLVPRLAFAGATVAAVAIALVLALGGGGTGGPTVADAAGLASRPPTGPAPPRQEGSRTLLAADVDGVQFPDFRGAWGWRASGIRHDRVDGRDATVVYYRMGGRRIGYVIVSGSALPQPSGGVKAVRLGVEYHGLRAAGRPTVTWRRVGHTCVLTGEASPAELLALASWRGGGALSY